MNNQSTATTPREQFLDSLDRCASNEQFFPMFYERFMASSDDVRHRFESTSFERQNKMLLKSLKLCADVTEGKSDALAELTARAETHAHNRLDIKPELYSLWLDSLLTTAAEFDSKWDRSIEDSWRVILGLVIHRMIEKY